MCQNNYNKKNSNYKHLTYTEKTMIERWYNKDKKNSKEISELLNKCERTIRREIQRGKVITKDSLWRDRIEYSADVSHDAYLYNIRGKGQVIKLNRDYELVRYIEKEIKENKKSPEAIIGEIHTKGLIFKTKVTARTIRNNIDLGDVFDLTNKDLTYNKKHNNKNKDKHISINVPPEKSIEFRPKEADNRSEYGHWEGDLVIGKRKGKGAVLLTFTERMTREEIIIKLENKEKENVRKAFNKLERQYGGRFYNKFKTITFDNGSEFKDYEALENSCLRKSRRTYVYYAHPYCSGERGSNENNNRLIRRWIPKGMELNEIGTDFIKKIEDWINNYPRAMFGYKSTNMILLNI